MVSTALHGVTPRAARRGAGDVARAARARRPADPRRARRRRQRRLPPDRGSRGAARPHPEDGACPARDAAPRSPHRGGRRTPPSGCLRMRSPRTTSGSMWDETRRKPLSRHPRARRPADRHRRVDLDDLRGARHRPAGARAAARGRGKAARRLPDPDRRASGSSRRSRATISTGALRAPARSIRRAEPAARIRAMLERSTAVTGAAAASAQFALAATGVCGKASCSRARQSLVT